METDDEVAVGAGAVDLLNRPVAVDRLGTGEETGQNLPHAGRPRPDRERGGGTHHPDDLQGRAHFGWEPECLRSLAGRRHRGPTEPILVYAPGGRCNRCLICSNCSSLNSPMA